MPDLLQHSSAWLESQRNRYMTRTVIYQRGNESAELPATVGRTIFQIDDGMGASIRSESRDYLIDAVDLRVGDMPILPRRGDRIIETQGGQSFSYEVMAPGDEPCWRYSDLYRQTLRIHTKQVEVE